MAQYNCDVWTKRSEILSPLTKLTKGTKNGPIKWTPECETALQEIKQIIAKEVLLDYPDFSKNSQFIQMYQIYN